MPEFDPETSGSAADSIRSAVAAAFDSQDAPEDPAGPSKPEPAVAKESRQRGPDGKFQGDDTKAPANVDTAGQSGPGKADAQAAGRSGTDGTGEPAVGEAKPTPRAAPENWSPADKALFAKQAPDAQEFLLRRHVAMEADYTRKTQEVAAFRRDYEPIHQMLAPHAEVLREKGFTPASLIQAWYQVERQLLDPVQAITTVAGIVKNYKLPPEKVAAALGLRVVPPDGQPPAPAPDGQQPIVLPPELLDKLTRHDQFIAQQQEERQRADRQAFDAKAQAVMNDIEKFASATDSAGALQHPYFQEVEADMQRLVLATRASGMPVPPLSELYDQAVWANPSTRKQMLDAQRAAETAQRGDAERKKQEEARARAERARRAGASVNGSPGGQGQGTGRRGSNGSVRDDLAAAMEEIEA